MGPRIWTADLKQLHDTHDTLTADEFAGALDVRLTPEEIAAREECCVPHPVAGAINANPPQGVMLLDEKK